MGEVDWICTIDMTIRGCARAGMSPQQHAAHLRLALQLPASVFERPRAGELPRRVALRVPHRPPVFLRQTA